MLNLITAIKGKYWVSQHKRVSGNMLQKTRNVCEFEIPAPELSSAYSQASWKRVKGAFPEAPHFSGAVGDHDCWLQVPEASLERHIDRIDDKIWSL